MSVRSQSRDLGSGYTFSGAQLARYALSPLGLALAASHTGSWDLGKGSHNILGCILKGL